MDAENRALRDALLSEDASRRNACLKIEKGLRKRCGELEAALLHFTTFTSAEMAIEFYNHNVAIAREESDGREDE